MFEHVDQTMSLELFTLASGLFILANIIDTLDDYRKNRTLAKQPFSWLTSYLSYGMLTVSLLLFTISCYDKHTGKIIFSLALMRGIWLIAGVLLARAATKIGLLCREMYVRWHIFGNR